MVDWLATLHQKKMREKRYLTVAFLNLCGCSYFSVPFKAGPEEAEM